LLLLGGRINGETFHRLSLDDYTRRAEAARAEADSLVRRIDRFKEETAPQS